eukprot:1032159-Prymnesium_polylepis.1
MTAFSAAARSSAAERSGGFGVRQGGGVVGGRAARWRTRSENGERPDRAGPASIPGLLLRMRRAAEEEVGSCIKT